MSKTGDHAEDAEHELEDAGREVGEAFVDAVKPPEESPAAPSSAKDS